MLDRLTGMAVFVRAADLGSFAAAGTAMGLSAQMVGKHVGAIEVRLGTPLLRRTTRRQSLTEVGRLFYERCRVVLAEVEAADALVEGMGATPRGRLRVSAPVGYGACRLAPVVLDFLARYPDTEVELGLTDRYVDPVDEGYDVVVRLGPLGDSALAAREIAGQRQVACAAPAYLARRGAPATPADLEGHDCLAFVNWSGLPYAEWRFARDGRVEAVTIRSRLQVNDGRVLAAAAVAGHGIVLQPEPVLRDALAAGALVPVLADYDPPARPVFLVFGPRPPQPPKLRAFIDHVAAALPRDVPPARAIP